METKHGRIKTSFEWISRARNIDWLFSIAKQWVIPVMAAVGTGIWGLRDYLVQWGYLPIAIICLVVFVVTLWGINGIIWFSRQNRPSRARLIFDYSYGIALDEITPSHDIDNDHNCLEFRFQIRNVAPGPMKYNAERIDVIIGDRIRTARAIAGILPRDGRILLRPPGFDKITIDSLENRVSGNYEFSIIYGHPADKYSRKLVKRIHFDLIKRNGIVSGAPWSILSESDNEI
jgi:hypothetical protein